ncbi:MAG: NAD-dependent epimerase/dehydratase family protein [Armatimonadota bacterium]
MRIVVTGGAGFIGSQIAAAYIENGHTVAVVDDLSSGREKNVPECAEFAKIHITDRDEIGSFWRDFEPDIVNHHAAQIDVRKSVQNPVFDARVNILGSLNVIKSSMDTGVKKIIYASTGGAIYGDAENLPASESYPPRPLSCYGTSKHAVEGYLATFARLDGLDYTVLRYANVYGPRQRSDGEAGVVAIFAGQMFSGIRPTIFGDGTKTRDYVYVGDVVAANRIVLDSGSGVYNIGTGVQTTDQEVFDAVADAVGYDEEPIYADERPGEVHHIALDISRARDDLGWQPTVDFRDGVKRTIEYMRGQLDSAETRHG